MTASYHQRTIARLGLDGPTLRSLRRNNDGEFPPYAWPGGYPILYYVGSANEPLCPDCANRENGSEATLSIGGGEWRITGAEIFYEGASEQCSHCNAKIESAYGDPEEPSDGDYVLSDSGPLGTKTSVSEHGARHLGEFETEDEALEFIRARMKVEKFWPTVWRVSDHGNLWPVNVTEEEET
jgi:hypothetical protein